MSIFTVLKYSGTDLGSRVELLKLPVEIVNRYYNRVLSLDNYTLVCDKIELLTLCYVRSLTAAPSIAELHYRRIFNEILTEYEDPE